MKHHLVSEIEMKFLSFFTNKGYIHVPAEPLIPKDDPTLAFTNATIVPLKKSLLSGFAAPGFVLSQPCLRLRNLQTNNFSHQFTSFFRMVSILAHPSVGIQNIISEISEYLSTMPLPANSELIIHYTDSVTHLTQGWNSFFILKKNARNGSFYEWKYGLKSLKGRGVTFSVATDGNERELGNFVEIVNGKETIGYEFGFGLESCVAILNNMKSNYEVLFTVEGDKKLLDLTCAYVIAHHAIISNNQPLHGTTISSFKKLSRETVRTIDTQKKEDLIFIEDINWEALRIPKDSVRSAHTLLTKQLKEYKERQHRFIAYHLYLDKMYSAGKSRSWVNKKMNEYAYKNNVRPITQPSNHDSK